MINCIECGKEFEPRHAARLLCSDDCQEKRQARQRAEYKRELTERKRMKICSECGKEFKAEHAAKLCCSEECDKARRKRMAGESRSKQTRKPPSKSPKTTKPPKANRWWEPPSREFTDETAYLVQKWFAEGTSKEIIAYEILDRPLSDIERALEVEI